MNQKKRQILIFLLATWVIMTAIIVVVRNENLRKQTFDTPYEKALAYFLEEAGPTLINPPRKSEVLKAIKVSETEINEYRYRFGDKESQISNIMQQYEEAIVEAQNNENTERERQVIEERDKKIADIKRNFEDDAYVIDKITLEKEKMVDSYFAQLEDKRKELQEQYPFISYHLTEIESGEDKVKGNSKADALFKKEYHASNDKIAPLYTQTYDEELLHIFYNEPYNYWPNLNQDDRKNPVSNVTYKYKGQVIVDKALYKASAAYQEYEIEQKNKWMYYGIVLSGIVASLILVMLKTERSDFLRDAHYITSMSIDLIVMLTLLSYITVLVFAVFLAESLQYQTYTIIFELGFLLPYIIWLGVVYLALLFTNAIYTRVRQAGNLQTLLQESYTMSLLRISKDLLLNRTIFIQTIILLSATFVGGASLVLIFFMGAQIEVFIFLVCFLIGSFCGLVYLARMAYLNRIMKDTESLSKGTLNRPIKVKGKSVFSHHASNLNHLRAGVQQSMTEQAKSERLKTELITNVSHDLRTPLTSIITYTDLLKNENLTPEERRKYVDVLDKKSERLKVLIEDLFEVSKMASGNVELNKQRIDFTELVQQVVGEHEEDLRDKNLDLRLTLPNESLYSVVDGQKMWRLLDNLLINVGKYALPHTRVYVTLQVNERKQIELLIKNIAKYEIGDNVDELFERFKRADKSRHTEGSGLGLAIAQSIVDMHGGTMSISVDGDLFKVAVQLEKTQ